MIIQSDLSHVYGLRTLLEDGNFPNLPMGGDAQYVPLLTEILVQLTDINDVTVSGCGILWVEVSTRHSAFLEDSQLDKWIDCLCVFTMVLNVLVTCSLPYFTSLYLY